MTFTYVPDFSTVRDQVRLMIGDTLSTDPQLSDEEIAYLVTRHGADPVRVAIGAVGSLIARYSREVSNSMDGVSESSGERIKNYQLLLGQLKAENAGLLVPVAGGLVDPDTGEDVEPFFTRKTPEMVWGLNE